MIEHNTIYNEPCLSTISRMEDSSIDCVITSPPYWQLRDYGYESQWGLEPTFQLYLEHLWEMMSEIYRVLKPSGTCWVNLGDTYGTQSGNSRGISYNNNDSTYLRNRERTVNRNRWAVSQVESGSELIKQSGLHKCLLLIPHRFAIGCIDRGWIVRNDVIWAKRNGMPESVTDRFSKKHEYFFFMVKSEKYYFDLDGIRDRVLTHEDRPDGIVRNRIFEYDSKMNNIELNPKAKNIKGNRTEDGLSRTTAGSHMKTGSEKYNENGKNPGSVSDFWDIPTKPSSEKHYASYNDSLLVKPVLSGCPEGGIIYDPFMGTGSTAEVAIRSKRKFIGSEMSSEYCRIAENRLEPFLMQPTLL